MLPSMCSMLVGSLACCFPLCAHCPRPACPLGEVVAILRVPLSLPVLVTLLVLVVSCFSVKRRIEEPSSQSRSGQPQRRRKGRSCRRKGRLICVARRNQGRSSGAKYASLSAASKSAGSKITPTMPSHCFSGVEIKAAHGRQHPCSGKGLTGQVCLPLRLLPPLRSSYLCFLFATS